MCSELQCHSDLAPSISNALTEARRESIVAQSTATICPPRLRIWMRLGRIRVPIAALAGVLCILPVRNTLGLGSRQKSIGSTNSHPLRGQLTFQSNATHTGSMCCLPRYLPRYLSRCLIDLELISMYTVSGLLGTYLHR